MFGGFHVLAGLSIKLQAETRYSCLAVGWNVWGFHELGLFWRVPYQITTGKKVQSSGHQLQCLGGSMNLDCFGGFVAMFFGGFLDQITNYDWKKRYSHLAIGWNVYYVLLTHFEWGLFLWRADHYQNQYGK
jgi:hypothetical protein